jgi:hypothetical protein
MADVSTPGPAAVIPRSKLSLRIDPSLRATLARMASGRVLVIDYFASRRCSLTVGDLTAGFSASPPGPEFAALASIEGVCVLVERRLLPVLRAGGATLVLAGPVFARHLSVRLERPELWLDFLAEPGVVTGKRGFNWPRPHQPGRRGQAERGGP